MSFWTSNDIEAKQKYLNLGDLHFLDESYFDSSKTGTYTNPKSSKTSTN